MNEPRVTTPQPQAPFKKHLRNALLVLVFGSLLYVLGKEILDRHKAESSVRTPTPAEADTSRSPRLIVYYFAQGKDCVTCEHIPAYTKEALDQYYGKELSSGEIAWRPINVDDPANEHFVTEYNLYTKSIVLAKQDGDKQTSWKNLDAVWDLVYDKPAFVQYVRDQIREYLDQPQ